MACPICGNAAAQFSPLRRAPEGHEAHHVPCDRCGTYLVTRSALVDLPATLSNDVERITRLAHGVRRMQQGKEHPFVTNDLIERLLEKPLPTIFEQADLLLRWVGQQTSGPGEFVDLQAQRDLYIIGAKSSTGFGFVVKRLIEGREVEGTPRDSGSAKVKLTFSGWDRLEQLQRGAIDSRKAFMAMKYGDTELDQIVDTFFRPAVAQTLFTLSRLDDLPKAGLIDDRLRVEIRGSRFLIADLSHDNLGAYWEAGFAEGLGKPVIYTCEREKFAQTKTHFDTNHHLTVVWDRANPATAAEELKATIRATLPAEAKQTD